MAEKQYIKGCRLLSAAPRSKRRQLLGAGASGGMSMAGANASAGDGAYLSKIKDDAAQGHITFENGATVAAGQRFYFADIEHFIELDEDGSFHFSHDVYTDGDIVAGGWQTPGEDDVPVVAALSDLTDVKFAGLAAGDLLQWNGTDWVNVKASELGIGGSVDLSNYVTIDTAQEITGAKTFTSVLRTNSYAHIGATQSYAIMMGGSANYTWIDCRQGTTVVNNIVMYPTYTYFGKNIKAPAFVKDGGTSTQFLMADGSVKALTDITSAYVTAIGTSGNYVTWTKNGTANNITVPFATNADKVDGYHESSFFRSNITSTVTSENVLTKLPGNRSGSYIITQSGWTGSAYVLYCGGSNTGLAFYRPGGSNSIPKILVAVDSTSNWVDKGTILTSSSYSSTLDSRYVTLGTTQTISGVKTFTSNITCSRTGAAAQVIAGRDGRNVSLHSDSNRGVYDNSGSGWLIGTNGTNTFLMRGNVGIGITDPAYLLDANGSIRARNGWLRQSGNYGWYNETHGGGWFMQDSTWVRTYNSKAVYTGSGRVRSDHLFDRQGYAGTSWNAGYGAYNVAIVNNSAQTPLLLAYRSGVEPMDATGANRLFSMEFLNAGTALRLYFGGVHRFTFYSNGNFESTGDQVSASSSDRRLKQRFAVEDYTARIMRLGAVMDYEWSDKARTLDPGKYDAVRHSSVVWQRARKVGIPGFCGADDCGYGFVNWLNKDYQAVLLGAVQETIRAVHRHDDEIRRLRRRVSELEGIVNNKCA